MQVKKNRDVTPTVAIIDAVSIKTKSSVCAAKGYDGFKKVKGRKKQLVVDSQGFILDCKVHSASEHDSKIAVSLILQVKEKYPSIKIFKADKAYSSQLIKGVCLYLNTEMQTPCHSNLGFTPLEGRWVVERSIAWLGHWRVNSKDYEKTVQHSRTWTIITGMGLACSFLRK